MKTTIITLATMLSLAFAGAVQAQTYSSFSGGAAVTNVPSSGYGWGWSHSSTAEEGALRGWAELNRGAGEYNYYSSLAAINLEEARRRAIENHTTAVEEYYHRRQINSEYRDSVRRPTLTQEQLVQIAKDQTPDRMTAYQYEPALGRIFWPPVLESEVYAADRAAIDKVMARRTVADSGLGTDSHREIDALTRQMESKLRSRITTMSTTEYLAAKKFLQSLRYEARFAPGADGLVSN